MANDVSRGVFGEETNEVMLVSKDEAETWPRASKLEIARKLAGRIAETLNRKPA